MLAELPSLKTLIHEKVHLYQRYYPFETANFISMHLKLEPLDKIEHFLLARNNPDINSFVYGRDNYIIIQTYNSLQPFSLADSASMKHFYNGTTAITEEKEHPYETMAYLLAERIVSRDHKFVTDIFASIEL
jgi:hypothetical protein